MAAWTKNEGLLFAMVAGGAWCMHETARGSPHRIGAFVIGLLVALLPVLYFKIMLAPPNDIVASQPWDRWADLLDWSRHRLILLSLARDIVRFGDWSVVPFLAMLLPLIGGSWRQINQPERLVAFVLGLMLAGFYTVYLLTHWELRAHLDSSLVRVLLQLWPAAVFLWCLAVPYNAPDTMSTAAGSTGRRRTATTAVLLANVALGGAVFVAMDRQPAANELGGGTVRGDKVRVLLGEGWFGRESYEGDVWAWSKGESALLLQLDAKESRTITLRFSIRGVDTRTVTATMGERLVWRTVVGEQTDLVEITGLILQPGTTRIVFRSDTPGTPESTAPGARTITYALYNATVGEVGGSDK